MRKLASIQEIAWINPIEGKDKIELAGVLGWQVIVQKGEYKVGDKTVFVEIDSVLPERAEFEFLRSRKFRIKSMKMSNCLSQGICFPLSILPKGIYVIDQDVTNLMGITQYAPTQDKDPVQSVRKAPKNPVLKFFYRFAIFRRLFMKNNERRKQFPDFISKSDENRIQLQPHLLNNKEIKYQITEKVDGSSLTAFVKRTGRNKFDFGVCSRNLRLFDDDGTPYWRVVKKYDLENVLKALIGDNDFVAIQGEVIAPTIQGNKYKVTEPDLYVFNLIYPNKKIDSVTARDILSNYGVKFVPIIYENFTLLDTVNEMLEFADGKSALHDTLREGFVCRNYEKNISFKCVSPRFLIKNDE